jgi:riboflavin biosynthesis pyrimidine reductase
MSTVLKLWPPSAVSDSTAVTDAELYDLYAYPNPVKASYVRVNFVSSVNGVVTVDGRSGGLGSKADLRVFGLLRELADVILVGAGTARIEGYRGARSSERLRRRRRERGQAEVPPIAVVTAMADLDPVGPLFTDTRVPPLILTVSRAPYNKVDRLIEAGANVVEVGTHRAEVPLILEALRDRGLYRVLCEGGSQLVGDLIVEDAMDELCLTLAPYLVGGSSRISVSAPTSARPMSLRSAIIADGALLMVYRRERRKSGEGQGRWSLHEEQLRTSSLASSGRMRAEGLVKGLTPADRRPS